MKKLIAMLLALIMVLSLAACGASEPATAPTNAPVAADKADDTAKEPEVKTVSSTGHSLVPSSNTLKALWNTSSYDLNTTIEVGVIEEQTGFDIQWDALPAENTQEVLMMTIGSGSDYDMFYTNKANEKYPEVKVIVEKVLAYGKQASAHISIYYAMFLFEE